MLLLFLIFVKCLVIGRFVCGGVCVWLINFFIYFGFLGLIYDCFISFFFVREFGEKKC